MKEKNVELVTLNKHQDLLGEVVHTLIDWVLPIFLWDRAALEFDELSYIKAEKASVTQVLLLAIESSSDSFSTDLHDLTM